MGRELRMTPKNWEHPRNGNGDYIALLSGDYKKLFKEYKEGLNQWQKGYRDDFDGGLQLKEADEQDMSYKEWAGERPYKVDYMPQWKDEEKTHFQMYETCTEGTPISPVMDTPEGLALWLEDNKASSFGSMTATYDQWLSAINSGYTPSAVLENGVLKSGVEGLSK